MKKETTTLETPTTVETQKVKGRPVNESSKRQQKLAKREEAKANGTFRKGRPVVGTSKRQEVLAQRKAKIEANGELKRGRPSVEGSKRQLKLKAKAEKIASGIEVKRGRPKAEAVIVEPIVVAEVSVEKTVEKVKAKRKK
jgi:hypothetical protein